MDTTRAVMFAAVIGLSIAGCKKKNEAAPAATGTGSGSGSGTAAANAPLPAEVAVDEAAVKQAIDGWVAAQNGGDFAGYQAAYADKMEGVKRVGARTWRFDRAGWFADRARMFKNPMTVTASIIAIRGSANAPAVELVQTFKQGKFSDQGPKHLALIKTPVGFRIAREEMLASMVGGAAAAAGPGTIYLTMELDGKPQVVIKADADPAWGKGAIAGPFDGMHKLATQDASAAPTAASWTGRALAVYAADGTRCEAAVGAVRLLGGGTPHFGEVQGWNDEYDMGDGHVWSGPERARAVFDMSTPYLIGELAITGACEPLFAADPAATPAVIAPSAADPALQAAAITAFRALPAYKELQKDWVDSYEGKGPWIDVPAVEVYGDYYVVSASAGDGCGQFLGQLFAIYENRGGRLALITDPDDGYLRLDAIVDTDGDGKIELIGAVEDFRMVTAHLTPTGTHFAPTTEVTFPFNDCGC